MKTKRKPDKNQQQEPEKVPVAAKVNFYPGWCKRCGICVEFCPRHALASDEWGNPYMERPDKCISCHLCEKLCPDFAIRVKEEIPEEAGVYAASMPSPGSPGSPVSPNHSPERIAPDAAVEENSDE